MHTNKLETVLGGGGAGAEESSEVLVATVDRSETSSEGGTVGPGGGGGGFDRETNVGEYYKLTLMNSAGVGEIGGGSEEMEVAPGGAGSEGGSVESGNTDRET